MGFKFVETDENDQVVREFTPAEYHAFVAAEKATAKELRNSAKLAAAEKRVEKLTDRLSAALSVASDLQKRLETAKAELAARVAANSPAETVAA